MSNKPTEINTGGGAYVGGSVTTGGDFVGRDQNKNIITGNDQQISLEQFQSLLAELRALIPKAGFAEDEQRIIDADVEFVEAKASEAAPNKAIIVSRLNSLTEILQAGGNLTEAGKKLLPLATKAVQWVNQLFV